MLKMLIGVCFLFSTFPVYSLGLVVFVDKENAYVLLNNSTRNPVRVAEMLVHYRCDSRANLCLELIDSSGETRKMLPRPIRIDPDRFGDHELWPGKIYGRELTLDAIAADYGLSPGTYQLSAVYRDHPAGLTIRSNSVRLEVKD